MKKNKTTVFTPTHFATNLGFYTTELLLVIASHNSYKLQCFQSRCGLYNDVMQGSYFPETPASNNCRLGRLYSTFRYSADFFLEYADCRED